MEAADILENCTDISEKDQLLCYMEKGLILFDLGNYESCSRVLLNASHLMKEQDIISISKQTSAVLINDRVITYRGEYSEQLWVHTFLMMSFLLQYEYDSALVEAKQALELLETYPDALDNDYFTRALAALCFENLGKFNDVRIEYDKLSEVMPGELPKPGPVPSGRGELVLFAGQGRIPWKVSTNIVLPPSIRLSIPRYSDSPPSLSFQVKKSGRTLSAMVITTNLGEVVRKSLQKRSAGYIARQTLRAGAKEALAQAVGDETELGEVLVRAILFLTEEADTRSWETLPNSLSLVRIELEPGLHNLEIVTGSIEHGGINVIQTGDIEIVAGKRIYKSLRW